MSKLTAANIKKTLYYLRRNGLKNTYYAAKERLSGGQEAYCFTGASAKQLKEQRDYVFDKQPLFSILVPTYRTAREYLLEMMDSVLEQTYGRLELILADATEDDSVETIVREYMSREQERYGCQRIRYHRLGRNGGISENSNEALKLAAGDYIGLLDHDDVLTPDALYEMALQLEKCGAAGVEPLLLYSDEDKCDQERSVYFEPHYKTDFNLDLLLSNNYICHFLVMKRELMQSLGFRKEYDGAQDYDLVLRAVTQILPEEERIVHVPKVLYHWRCHTGSTAENPQSKTYAYEAGKRALQDTAKRMGWNARAEHLKHLGFYELCYEPDMFAVRADVGAIGGSLTGKDGELVSGAYDDQGNVLYAGLPRGYTGYMHRGVLLQSAAAVDIRMIRVRPECRALFAQTVGVPYVESGNGCFAWQTLSEGTDYQAVSMALGTAMREAGYRICWNPGMSAGISERAKERK